MIGVLVGFAIVLRTLGLISSSILRTVGIVSVSIVVCSLLAWRFGDRFFYALSKWLRWPR
jgi:hypothetical protein